MGRMYLVLDGLDETEDKQKNDLLQFLEEIKEEKSKISILITSRAEDVPSFGLVEPTTIYVTKEKIVSDLKVLAKHRLRTLPRLRKFRPLVRKLILRKVIRHANCFLYVEHMLRRLSDKGREDLVLKALEEMPATLDDLYKLLLEGCVRDRTEDQFATLKTLFAWLAFSKKPLTLGDCLDIVDCACRGSEDPLDLEGEIIGRSSRILELSQANRLEDSDNDPFGQTDGEPYEESTDEDNANFEEDTSWSSSIMTSPLTFQERSLRQYFRNVSRKNLDTKDLRTPATDSHLVILTMCADMLNEAVEKGKKWLPGYQLIRRWHEYFMEISLDGTSDEVAGKVLKSLYQILVNIPTSSQLLQDEGLYSQKSLDMTAWYDRVVEWAIRGVALAQNQIPSALREWAGGLSAESLILALTEGLFKAWVSGDDVWSIMQTWWMLKPAFELYISLRPEPGVDSSPDPMQEIVRIADTFEPGDKSAQTLRAIGATASQREYKEPNSITFGGCDAETSRYLKKSVELMETNTMEKINTIRIITDLYGVTGDLSIPLSYLDECLAIFDALESQEMTEQDRQEFNRKRRESEADKARLLKYSDEKEAPLEMYNGMLRTAGDDIPPTALGDMAQLCDELDSTGHKFMDMFKSWSNVQRNEWFEYFYSWKVDTQDLGKFAQMSKSPGGLEIILGWLTEFEKNTVNNRAAVRRGLLLLNVRSVLAHIHHEVASDVEQAKKIMISILSIKPESEPWDEDRIKEALTEEWMRLAGVIFQQFQASPDPQQKEALLKELKQISRIHINDDLKDSHVGMLLANMLRVMGPSREYHRYMEEIFATCIAGLEDSVSYNDGPSLRLLAKILSSLEGLERDARIAYSAQFSILDRTIHEKGQNSRTNSYGVHIGGELPFEKSQSESDELQDVRDDGDRVETQADAGQKASDQTAVPQLIPPEKGTEAVPVESNDLNNEYATKMNGDSLNEAPEFRLRESRPWIWEEDRCGYEIFCDSCRIWQLEWAQHLYLCLICPTTDICERCYDKEVAQRRAEVGKDQNHSYACPENHRYLRGYMKGWKGIKNGIIRIDDEELPVKEWIKGLKEERLRKAWKQYWLRQGGLRDIDDGNEAS